MVHDRALINLNRNAVLHGPDIQFRLRHELLYTFERGRISNEQFIRTILVKVDEFCQEYAFVIFKSTGFYKRQPPVISSILSDNVSVGVLRCLIQNEIISLFRRFNVTPLKVD